MRAIWNGETIAKSDQTRIVEGNHYFPPDALRTQFLRPSDTTTVCGWKGTASYYHLSVGGDTNEDAAWFYADPKPEAEQIRGYVAFWKGVQVQP
jgi:uncharacterized protein (DUF427 family)